MKKILYLLLILSMSINASAGHLQEIFTTDETCSSPPELIIPGVSTDYLVRIEYNQIITTEPGQESLFLQQIQKDWYWEIYDDAGNLVKTVDITSDIVLSYPDISDLGAGDYQIFFKVYYKETPSSYQAGKFVQVTFNGTSTSTHNLEAEVLEESFLVDCIRIQECSDITITLRQKLNRVCLQVTGECENYTIIPPNGSTQMHINTIPRQYCIFKKCGYQIYTFKVIDCNGCVHTKSIRAFRPCEEIPNDDGSTSASGRHNNSSEASMNMYPNPAQTTLNLNWDKQVESAYIVIFNSMGKTISEMTINQISNSAIDVSSFDSGHYFLRCNYQNGVVETLRFAVVR